MRNPYAHASLRARVSCTLLPHGVLAELHATGALRARAAARYWRQGRGLVGEPTMQPSRHTRHEGGA